MIGKFYDYLFEIGDRYAETFGKNSIPAEIVREISDALHRAYDAAQEHKELVNDRSPESLEEILAFNHENVTVYIDPDDGQLMYDLCTDRVANTHKYCDTAYEVVQKIVNRWDTGWRQAEKLQERVDDLERQVEKLEKERRQRMFVEKCLREALMDYVNGKDVMCFKDGDLKTAVSVSSLLDGKRFLVNLNDMPEEPEPAKEEPKKPEKPKPMKKPEKPEIKINYPTPAEKIKECLDQLSEANRERVQPLTETEAAIAIRLNNPYRLKQNRISRELGLTQSTISMHVKNLRRYFGNEVVESGEIPFVRKKEDSDEETIPTDVD